MGGVRVGLHSDVPHAFSLGASGAELSLVGALDIGRENSSGA